MKNINEISAVASIGGGPIGAGWTAHFLAKGLNVKCYLHSEDEIDDYKSLIETAWQTLEKLGINENASIKNMQIYTDLKESLTDVDFVQESIPEILEIKQDFYSQIDLFLKPDVIIASSTSGLLISEIVKNCDSRDRAIVGHPFNPPYLLPLVEVVASEYTDKALVEQAVDFYRAFDKVPIVLNKEILNSCRLYRFTVQEYRECARIDFGVIKFLIFSLFSRHLGLDRAQTLSQLSVL